MSLVLIVSILIRIVAMALSGFLAWRLRERRMGFLTAMLALMAMRQSLTLASRGFSPTLSLTAAPTELPGLAVSVMALLAVVFLARISTEQRRSKAALQEANAFTDRIVRTMPGVLVLYDVSGQRISHASGAVAQMLGYSPADIQAIQLSQLLHPNDGERLEECLRRVGQMPEGSIATIEARWKHADGDWRWVSAAITAFGREDDGGLREALLVCHDVTESKGAAQAVLQSQKMEAIGTLAGGIAHDFNNILSVLLGNIQMAQADTRPGTPAYVNLEDALQAGKRAAALVDQILVLSRRGQSERGIAPLREVVEESLRFMRATLPASVQIRKDLGHGCDFVPGDATELHQVIMNLCLNAAHAMERQGGSLTVRLAGVDLDAGKVPDLSPGPYMRLTVQDTGCGVDPRIAGRIFEPFFTTKELGQGTGLGLSVTRRIVTAHGGGICLDAQRTGSGSTFHVYLPRLEAAPAAADSTVTELPRGSERVLVVDDEESVVTVTRLMLETLGYDVLGCKSATEALERFRSARRPFDLVITDAIMPAMSGIQLARQVARARPEVAIILCTGFTSDLSEKELKAAEIRAYLRKPVLIDSLARTVRQVLDPATSAAESADGTYPCH